MFSFEKCVFVILSGKHLFNSVLGTIVMLILLNLKLSTYLRSLRSPHNINVFCKVVCTYKYLNLYSVKNLIIMDLK